MIHRNKASNLCATSFLIHLSLSAHADTPAQARSLVDIVLPYLPLFALLVGTVVLIQAIRKSRVRQQAHRDRIGGTARIAYGFDATCWAARWWNNRPTEDGHHQHDSHDRVSSGDGCDGGGD